MAYYKVKTLNNVVKIIIMLLISFCLPLAGHPQAEDVNTLIQKLKDRDPGVRWWAAGALGQIKDVRAVEVLVTALKGNNLEVVAGAYPFFIRRGEKGTETLLIKALNKYGTREMAEDFLNCGNNQLENAARSWASRHGYRIIGLPGIPGIPRFIWGQ